jgi:hypothetical protein
MRSTTTEASQAVGALAAGGVVALVLHDRAALEAALSKVTMAVRSLESPRRALHTVDGDMADGRNPGASATTLARQRLTTSLRNRSVVQLLQVADGGARDVLLVYNMDAALSADKTLGSWMASAFDKSSGKTAILFLLLQPSLLRLPPRWRRTILSQPWNASAHHDHDGEDTTTAVFSSALRKALTAPGTDEAAEVFVNAIAEGTMEAHMVPLLFAQNPSALMEVGGGRKRGGDDASSKWRRDAETYADVLRLYSDITAWGHVVNRRDLASYTSLSAARIARRRDTSPSPSAIKFPVYISLASRQASRMKAEMMSSARALWDWRRS